MLGYIVATRIRKEMMKWDIYLQATRRMLTDFGCQEGDLPGGGEIIEI